MGLEAASPLNLVVLEAQAEAEGEEVQRVFAEAEDTRRVCLTQLAAIVFCPSPSISRRVRSTSPARERVLCGLDLDVGQTLQFPFVLDRIVSNLGLPITRPVIIRKWMDLIVFFLMAQMIFFGPLLE